MDASNLCKSFSSTADTTQRAIPYLYSLLDKSLSDNGRVRTLYEEWKRIFGTIYEKQESDFVKHVSAIQQLYPINAGKKEIDVIRALFVIQTYYSIIVKLLIQNLFASLKLPTTKSQPLEYLSDVIGLFYGKRDDFNSFIDNFYELNYFEWFTMAGDLDLTIINEIISDIEQFETTASIIKPEIVSDVLKSTYESLMPKDLRHLMGEYYTPEWLVDFTIDKTGYSCGINESVIDPTCGSCMFITRLINRYVAKYGKALSYQDIVEHIVDNFVGFDINPIAVIQSKCNYILALGDITQLHRSVSVPVYMCDSILVPTVHAKQRSVGNVVEIETSVGKFKIPLLASRQENDLYLKTLSTCILNDYTEYKEFESRLKGECGIELDKKASDISKKLFDRLLSCHMSSKDGFWPIILKNSFAPLFCKQRFDYVMGNPPWIAWKAMSESYRNLTLDIWLSYGIFEKNAYDKITSHDDFAMAVTYVSIDHYLKDNGIAGFILPQTFVKSPKGGEGFRKFRITRDGKNEDFAISAVYDMLKVTPFKGIASNKTSVYIFEKNKPMSYPMDNYYECFSKRQIQPYEEYNEIKDLIQSNQLSATPINSDVRSPWLTIESRLAHHLNKYFGKSGYSARKGIEPCGAKGVYLVNADGLRNGKVHILNCLERSRRKDVIEKGLHPGYIEPDLLYPMLGGRNFTKWGIKDYLYMVVPHSTTGAVYHGIDESAMKASYPATYDWLFFFHDVLLDSRIKSAKFFDPKQFPWYRLDNVGEYTFKPYKVLWKEQSKGLDSCVVSAADDKYLGKKTFVVDSKVLFVSLDNENEAYYLSGILNSKDIDYIIRGYTISTNKGIDVVKNIKIPKYDSTNKTHIEIADLSKQAHAAFARNNHKLVENLELKIDKLVPMVFTQDD